MAQRPRIVIALADAAERGAVAQWLVEEGFDCVCRPNANAAADEMQSRPFDLLIADAAFAFAGLHRVGRSSGHPITPTIVVGDALVADRCEQSSWAMYLARPIDHALLVCTVSMAILDGRPLRRSVRKTVNFAAIVNGIPAQIIDVSNEGVRLEMPRDRCAVPPPYFTVRVPIIGVGVTVQRMWARPRPGGGKAEVTWCGGALAANPSRSEGAWRSFVDTLAAADVTGIDATGTQ
jgi:hypothetical protein